MTFIYSTNLIFNLIFRTIQGTVDIYINKEYYITYVLYICTFYLYTSKISTQSKGGGNLRDRSEILSLGEENDLRQLSLIKHTGLGGKTTWLEGPAVPCELCQVPAA